MSRSVCILFASVYLFQATLANPVQEDAVVKAKTLNLQVTDLVNSNLIDETLASVGDLTVGKHMEGEVVYQDTFEFENGLQEDLAFDISVTIPSGTIHYVNAKNGKNSNAVITATPKTLGSSAATVGIRLLPMSKPKIKFTIGAH
ncbi:uncharacterized protein LOC144469540 [Augochlora pura]